MEMKHNNIKPMYQLNTANREDVHNFPNNHENYQQDSWKNEDNFTIPKNADDLTSEVENSENKENYYSNTPNMCQLAMRKRRPSLPDPSQQMNLEKQGENSPVDLQKLKEEVEMSISHLKRSEV